MGTSPCPQYPRSFSHTPTPLFMLPFAGMAFPSPLFIWESPPLFYDPAQMFLLQGSLSHMSSFTWSTNPCGGPQVTGANEPETNSEGNTQTYNERSFGNQKTLPRKLGSSVDVLNVLVAGDSKCWWNERDVPGWVRNPLGTQGSHGALLGASESQIHGKISCSVTRNVTPTGQRAWLLMLPRPREDGALD